MDKVSQLEIVQNVKGKKLSKFVSSWIVRFVYLMWNLQFLSIFGINLSKNKQEFIQSKCKESDRRKETS